MLNEHALIDYILDAGLLQFGYFVEKRESGLHPIPIRLNFQLLPAYPQVLRLIAETIVAHFLDRTVDRVVCPSDSLPLGTAVSLLSGKPLVYVRGKGENPIHDLVGAYDVGHPAALVMNQLITPQKTQAIIREAQRVGLDIQQSISVCGLRALASNIDTPIRIILSLEDMLARLYHDELLNPAQKNALDQWISDHSIGTFLQELF